MTRNKGAAPAPPVRPKPTVKFSNSANANDGNSKAATGSSLVLLFDELTRNSRVLREGGCEEQFLQFAANQGLCRKRWHAAEGELLRMRTELERCEGEVRKLELKLEQARDLLSTETSQRKKAEQERDMMGQKWDMVREFISQSGDTMNDETRTRLQRLEASFASRKGAAIFSPGAGLGLSPVHEDSTCSILDASDLSFDNTQGSILGDDSRLRSGRAYKRKSSGGGAALAAARQEKRSRGGQGPRKSLEALAHKRRSGGERFNERNIDAHLPSAPPMMLEDTVMDWQQGQGRNMAQQASAVTLTPSVASTFTLVQSDAPATPANPVRPTHSNNRGLARPHQFAPKNNFNTESCGPCQKRIKFGKSCYKCHECRMAAHPECRDKAPLPCVPCGSGTKTPSKAGQGYTRGLALADYTPPTNPMVPAIIVHCANEVESRGLAEVGIYRVPGSEREVKDLRDKFLAGRGCPNLGQVDVHVLCGVIKDFLRNLREPLVPSSMWNLFTQAAGSPDSTEYEFEIFQEVIEQLQPNRDTMAFIMLDLQKVAAAKKTKLEEPGQNSGSTIIGYSSRIAASPGDIVKEVDIRTLLA